MAGKPQNDAHLHIRETLSAVPEKPGVYLFRDTQRRVLYIGKAKELRSRMRSYFQKSAGLDMRRTAMMRSVSDFEFTVTRNELEALVLEANLIKQYRPRFNILLRDDKNYPYIKLTVQEAWPRLEVVRRIQKDGAKYYGPYVPAGAMWNTLSFIRDNYPIRTCKYSLEKRMRPCIQYQIKRCSGPCAGSVDRKEYTGMIREVQFFLEGKNRGLLKLLERKMHILSEDMKYEEAALLRDRIKAIHLISESQKAVAPGLGDVDVIGFFRKQNAVVFKILFSRNGIMIGSKDFHLRNVSAETDGYLMKNFLEQFYQKELLPPPCIVCACLPEDARLLSSWLSDKRGAKVAVTVPRKGIKRELVSMAAENAKILSESVKFPKKETVLKDLADKLHLSHVPEGIGAFDISNISGKEAVGAYVYWADGDFRKDCYRHIRMDAVQGPDDYTMMSEMVRRTFKHSELKRMKAELSEKIQNVLPVPDLIIIDGGKGQLVVARRALRELKIDTETISIAKDPDRVFLPGRKNPVGMEDGSSASLLVKRIRDEAHRFAIRYHKKLRSQKIFESPLERIPGIGRKRRFALLRHFGSIESIQSRSIEEIAALKGFNRTIARKILESLKTK